MNDQGDAIQLSVGAYLSRGPGALTPFVCRDYLFPAGRGKREG